MVTGKIMEVYRSCSNSFGSDKFIEHQNPWLLVKYSFTNPKWNIAKHKNGGLESDLNWRNISTMVMQSMTILPWHSACVYVNLHLLVSRCYLFAKELFRAWYVRLIFKYISWAAQEKTPAFSMISVTTPCCVYHVGDAWNSEWGCATGLSSWGQPISLGIAKMDSGHDSRV